jgi:HicB family
MHRTQLLIPPELHRRAAEAARARRLSLGSLVREALTEYLARAGDGRPRDDAIDEILLAEPYDDPTPDASLSVDADHHLYGAPRRRSRKRR